MSRTRYPVAWLPWQRRTTVVQSRSSSPPTAATTGPSRSRTTASGRCRQIGDRGCWSLRQARSGRLSMRPTQLPPPGPWSPRRGHRPRPEGDQRHRGGTFDLGAAVGSAPARRRAHGEPAPGRALLRPSLVLPPLREEPGSRRRVLRGQWPRAEAVGLFSAPGGRRHLRAAALRRRSESRAGDGHHGSLLSVFAAGADLGPSSLVPPLASGPWGRVVAAPLGAPAMAGGLEVHPLPTVAVGRRNRLLGDMGLRRFDITTTFTG